MSIIPVSSNELIVELCNARARLDRGIELLNRALDTREQIWWQIDMDQARSAVDSLVSSIERHRKSRP
jgi:hypothetical protein